MIVDPNSKEQPPIAHYYGDTVRRYLLLAGFLVLMAVIFDKQLQNFYLVLGVVGVLVFTILAGMTSPRHRSVIINTAALSGAMFLLFEYFAIDSFLKTKDILNTAFALREALAVVFLIIVYYSTKTIRGMSNIS